MKKIGIILDSTTAWGGSFQYAVSLLKALITFVKKNKYILIAFYNSVEWKDYLIDESIVEIELRNNYIMDNYIIDNESCLVVFSSTQADWASRLSSLVITPIHDLMHRYEYRFPESGSEHEKKERDRVFSGNVENAAAVLVDSQTGVEQVLTIYGRCWDNKIHVLPYCAPEYLNEQEEAVEIPFSRFIFYPAQFWKHKNHTSLLKAVKRLKDEGITINIVFVGHEKNGYDDVIDLIENYHLEKQVCILGYVKNAQMIYLYKRARALIMPTFFGPTNIPPIEAISLDCPVGVSDIYGMHEQLGEAALYFDPNNENEIADVIRRYWEDDDLCHAMIDKGRYIASRFSQERFNRDVEKIVKDVLEENEFYIHKILEMKEFCKLHSCIYVYGAGRCAYVTVNKLIEMYIRVNAVIVSDKNINIEFQPIFPVDILTKDDVDLLNGAGIIVAVLDKHQQNDIFTGLLETGVKEKDILLYEKSVFEYLIR